jgi:PAS domain S-box-containing protein
MIPQPGRSLLSEDSSNGAALRIAFAISLAGLAIGIQLLLNPLVAMDSYQVFLGAVAVSSMYAGGRAGLATLLLSGFGKLCFFMPPGRFSADPTLAVSLPLFLAVAGVICWIGGRLHASERGLASVLTSIGDAVIATDEKGRIQFMNPAAEALSGWPEAKAVKRHFSEVLRLRDQTSESTVKSDRSARIDPGTILDSKAGYAIPVAGSISVITNATGARSGAVIVLRDITERMRAEQERDRLLDDIQSALAKVKALSGMLPICAGCKKIRDERGQWYELETYITAHSEAEFSHGLCQECAKRYYPELESEKVS